MLFDGKEGGQVGEIACSERVTKDVISKIKANILIGLGLTTDQCSFDVYLYDTFYERFILFILDYDDGDEDDDMLMQMHFLESRYTYDIRQVV